MTNYDGFLLTEPSYNPLTCSVCCSLFTRADYIHSSWLGSGFSSISFSSHLYGMDD